MKRLVPAVLTTAALVVGGAAAGAYVTGADSQAGPASVSFARPSESPLPSAPTTAPPEQVRPAAPAVVPRTPKHLRLGEVEAPIVPVRLDDGTLVPPSDPQVLGWWGQPAGSAEGTTLLFGHTVSTGGGTLDDLEHTRVDMRATVSGVIYRVERVEVISKATLARRSDRLFAQEGDPKLVVVTCEGYDPATRTYADNVVVVAKPVR